VLPSSPWPAGATSLASLLLTCPLALTWKVGELVDGRGDDSRELVEYIASKNSQVMRLIVRHGGLEIKIDGVLVNSSGVRKRTCFGSYGGVFKARQGTGKSDSGSDEIDISVQESHEENVEYEEDSV